MQKDGKYANAKSLADLSGAKITAQLNTFHYDVIDQIPGVDKQQAMDNFSAMRTALTSGMIDGYISERPEGVTATSVNKDLKMLELKGENGFQTKPEDVQIAVGMRKGDPDIQKVNQILGGISSKERTTIMDQAIKDQPASTEDDEEDSGLLNDFKTIWDQYGNMFLRGAGLTLFIALIGTIVGTTLGLLIGVFRSIPEPEISKPTTFYLYRSLPWNSNDGSSNGGLLWLSISLWDLTGSNDRCPIHRFNQHRCVYD